MGLTPQPFGGSDFDGDNAIIEIVETIEETTGYRIFTCGSENCGNTIIIDTKKTLPSFCKLCGNEIDWTGVLYEIMIVCPKCKREYSSQYEYCEIDGSRLDGVEPTNSKLT